LVWGKQHVEGNGVEVYLGGSDFIQAGQRELIRRSGYDTEMGFIEPTDVLEIISNPRVKLEELALVNRGVGFGTNVQIRLLGELVQCLRGSSGRLRSPLLHY
jgi:hypothetical protein